MPRSPALIGLSLLAAAACSARPPGGPGPDALELWHTYQPHETEALNRVLTDFQPKRPVRATLLSFARGRSILERAVRSGKRCPDLVRVDATWLPGLVAAGALEPVPENVWAAAEWLPEAASMVTFDGVPMALPQSSDGLAFVHRSDLSIADWPPRTIDDLGRVAGALGPGHLGMRVDGYWFVPFLRNRGADLLDPRTGAVGVDSDGARQALDEFAALFAPGGAAIPMRSNIYEQSLGARFRKGELPIIMTGAWTLHVLARGELSALAVTPMPTAADGRPLAPRGGAAYAVPSCGEQRDDAWTVASALVSHELQLDWAKRFGIIPTTRSALDAAPALTKRFRKALITAARPLPAHPVSAELFDDLTPAVTARVLGDATAEEALAGVGRAWTRLARRHGIVAVDEQPGPMEESRP